MFIPFICQVFFILLDLGCARMGLGGAADPTVRYDGYAHLHDMKTHNGLFGLLRRRPERLEQAAVETTRICSARSFQRR